MNTPRSPSTPVPVDMRWFHTAPSRLARVSQHTHTCTRPPSVCGTKRRCWVSGYVCPQPCDVMAQSFTTWLHQHTSSIFRQPGLYFCALMPELVPVGPDALFLWHGALTRCCDYSNSPTCGTEKLKSVISLSRNKENNRKNNNSTDSNGATTP